MKNMGFRTARTSEIFRKILMEKPENIVKRHNYLREKREIENKYPNSLWVYLDETFLHKSYATKKILMYQKELPKVNIPVSKGLRFSIIHAGTEHGFVNDAAEVLIDERN